MKNDKKRFDWSLREYLNKSFWVGIFIGIFAVLGSMLIGNVAYYSIHKDGGFWHKTEQIGFFLDDYQKTLKNECRNSDDDVYKLLCFKLHRATSRYFKEMSQCFDKAVEMKNPDNTEERLKNFLDELAKENDRRFGRKKI